MSLFLYGMYSPPSHTHTVYFKMSCVLCWGGCEGKEPLFSLLELEIRNHLHQNHQKPSFWKAGSKVFIEFITYN